jgi:hypothetical protein
MAWLDLAECGLRWLSVPRSALADAFGPRSAARLSAKSGLGRWFPPRARTRVSDGKLDSNQGVDTRSLQHYLGHKNIQHTVRYSELATDRFKDFWRD